MGVWVFVFLQSFNSFDYILFLQLFFVGYYFLKRGRTFPYKRLIFFATAPVAGFLLHFMQNAVALGGAYNAYKDLRDVFSGRFIAVTTYHPFYLMETIGAMFAGLDKWLSVGFGSGFGYIFLMLAVFLFLEFLNRKNKLDRTELGNGAGLSPNRFFLLFTICSIVWWLLMIQATPSFARYMVRHAFPVVGVLFAVVITSSLEFARKKDNDPLLRFGAVIVIMASIWTPFINTAWYLREYPNLMQPKKVWALYLPLDTLIKGIEVSKKIREKTSYGDIVLVPRQFVLKKTRGGNQIYPLFEYYSQRRMEFLGESIVEFREQLEALQRYREEVPKFDKKAGRIKLFALMERDMNLDLQRYLLLNSQSKEIVNDKWFLFDLDSAALHLVH